MIRIGIDVDGVIRNMSDKTVQVFKKNFPELVECDLVYAYDFSNIKIPTKEKFDMIFNRFYKEIFYSSIPYPNAIEGVNVLKNWAKHNNAKIVCVTAQEQHLINLTYLWLGKYDVTFDELHIAKDKSNLALDYIIDDSPSVYNDWVKAGNLESHFFLMDRDWNKSVPATKRIGSIIEIVNYL